MEAFPPFPELSIQELRIKTFQIGMNKHLFLKSLQVKNFNIYNFDVALIKQ